MFRLIRLFVYLCFVAVIVWFGTNVELGKRTLFGHIQNIWKTHESRELVDGTKDKVGDLVDRASDKVVKRVGKGVTAPANSRGETAEPTRAAPLEDVESEDRKTLRELIGRKTKRE